MPLDQVVICYLQKRNSINVLLLRSLDLLKPGTLAITNDLNIEVAPNGISFNELDVEYRILLDDFFELAIKSDEGDPLYGIGDLRANNVSFGLFLERVRLRMLEHSIVDVKMGDLPLRIKSTVPCSLNCSNCANEVIRRQQYLRIQPVPVVTMNPQSFFCGRYKVAVQPQEDQLFYGLNYVVIGFLMMGSGMIRSWGRRRLECSRCRQEVGAVLGKDVAIQLFADALRVVTGGADDDNSPVQFREVFGHVTPTQLMIRLLHDAEPMTPDKTRLFLKAVRPDGQVHFLQMLVDTHQLHLLRSQLPAPRELGPSKTISDNDDQKSPEQSDTSSEGGSEIANSDSSSSIPSLGAQEAEVDMVPVNATPDAAEGSSQVPAHATPDAAEGSSPVPAHASPDATGCSSPVPVPQPPEEASKAVSYVNMRGFRACRMKYLFSGTDQELAEKQELLDMWQNEGAGELRVSYPMMMELLAELNANENMVAGLEKLPAPITNIPPRRSYIVYETDEDFYARQQLPLAELDI